MTQKLNGKLIPGWSIGSIAFNAAVLEKFPVIAETIQAQANAERDRILMEHQNPFDFSGLATGIQKDVDWDDFRRRVHRWQYNIMRRKIGRYYAHITRSKIGA